MEDDGVFGIQLLLLPASGGRVETSIHRIKRGGLKCFSFYVNWARGAFLSSVNVWGNCKREWTNAKCFDKWLSGISQEQGDKLVLVCQILSSKLSFLFSRRLPLTLLGGKGPRSVVHESDTAVGPKAQSYVLFCFFKQTHQQTHIDFNPTAGTWLCCIIISSLFQTITLCHHNLMIWRRCIICRCTEPSSRLFCMEPFPCAELRWLKDTQKPQLYLHRQLWWQSPRLNVRWMWKYCRSPLSRVPLKASISIKDSGSESSHYTQLTENMQQDIFPSDSRSHCTTAASLGLQSIYLYT